MDPGSPGGELIADTRCAQLLIDYGAGRAADLVHPARRPAHRTSDRRETAADRSVTWTVRAGGRTAECAAYGYTATPETFPMLADHVPFRWETLEWYEEDDGWSPTRRTHTKRVDVLPSSRHVHVDVAGVTAAESHRPTLMLETMLPVRHYLPREDARTDLLVGGLGICGSSQRSVGPAWS